ncbi:MAG: hypothetical protein R3272_09905 [Candidatus Promineifilaceae bacterium]|nr:hypothetical protein [Candidatus Promineifilaceae bacterium]
MNFDWRTDEEGWDEVEAAARADQGRPRRSRRFLWRRLLLSALFIAAALAAGGYRGAKLRVSQAMAEAEAGVLAAHRLLAQGAERGDQELVRQLVAQDDRRWRRAQVSAIPRRGLFGRPGLSLVAEASRPVPEVVLAPNLQTAVVSATLPYTITGLEEAAPFRLRQSLFYERHGQRWRLAQPEWGRWVTEEHGRFIVVYREEERPLAERLARDLSRETERMCAWLGGCPDALRLLLHLFPYPRFAVMQAYESGIVIVNAPGPLTLGQPLDEAGYLALLDYYRLAFAEGLVERLYAQRWSGDEQYVAAVRQRLHVEVGLQRRPVPSTSVDPPAIPFPDQDILALCVEPQRHAATLYRHELDSGRWTPLLRDDPLVSMLPLPDHAGVALQKKELNHRDLNPMVILWRPARAQLRLEGLTLLAVERHSASPTLRAIDRANELLAVDLSELAGCASGDCRLPVTAATGESWDSAWSGHWDQYGHWRLAVEDGLLALRGIDGARRTIAPPVPGCAFAAWVDR